MGWLAAPLVQQYTVLLHHARDQPCISFQAEVGPCRACLQMTILAAARRRERRPLQWAWVAPAPVQHHPARRRLRRAVLQALFQAWAVRPWLVGLTTAPAPIHLHCSRQ